jgi:hypothetical protein
MATMKLVLSPSLPHCQLLYFFQPSVVYKNQIEVPEFSEIYEVVIASSILMNPLVR